MKSLSTTSRVTSIDVLRGFAMCLMIFSAAISYHCGLPAWMYHCQVPPPDYVFNPAVRGITWVDLVFPFFIFSMGASLPFALRKRLDNGARNVDILLILLRRWITLVVFSLVIGNAEAIHSAEAPELMKGGFAFMIWVAMFLCLVRTGKKGITIAGYVLLLALLALEQFWFKVPLDPHHNDIIIMILSTVILFCGIIWLSTRHNVMFRALWFMFAVAIKAVSAYTGVLDFLEIPSWMGVIFNWGFLQYLIIALPATIIGDLLYKNKSCRLIPTPQNVLSSIVMVTAVVVQLVCLYLRVPFIDLGISALLFLIYLVLTKRRKDLCRTTAIMGFALLLAGVAFDYPDGGIAKDPCNLSYLLTTCGMAALMTSLFIQFEGSGWKGGFLARSGQNPMIAYTICWFVIEPLLYACGLMGQIDSLCIGSPLWGLIRGVILTALMFVFTGLFTRLRLFWRS